LKRINLPKESGKTLGEAVPDCRIGLNIKGTASQQHQKTCSQFSHATGSEAQLVPIFQNCPQDALNEDLMIL
jgi:hypothetical protein